MCGPCARSIKDHQHYGLRKEHLLVSVQQRRYGYRYNRAQGRFLADEQGGRCSLGPGYAFMQLVGGHTTTPSCLLPPTLMPTATHRHAYCNPLLTPHTLMPTPDLTPTVYSSHPRACE